MSRLQWQIDLDAKQGLATLKAFEQAQGRADRQMRDTGKSAGRLTKGYAQLQKTLVGLGGLIGGGLIVGGLVRMTTSIAEMGDNLAKTSTRLGIGTDELQKFHYIAERSGVRIETMNMALQRMIRRVSEAGQGTGEAISAIEELGLNAQQLAAMSPDEMFLKITEAMNKVEKSGDRVRLMFKLFDSEGVALKQVMDEGADSIGAMMRQVEDLGGIMSTEAIQASVEYKDSMADLSAAMKGLKVILGAELIPILTDFTHLLTEGAAGFAMWIDDISGESKQAQLRALNDELVGLYEQREKFVTAPEQDWWRDEFKPRMDTALADVDAKIQALIDKRNELMATPVGEGPGETPTGGEEEIEIINAFEARKEAIYAAWREIHAEKEREYMLQLSEEKSEWYEQSIQDFNMYTDAEGEIGQALVDERLRQQMALFHGEQQINQMRAMAQQSWMNTLYMAMQTFGARSQKWMMAMIAIETAINVARALIHGHAASVKALAEVPYPYNLVVSAKMLGLMWWNVAAIVAAGAIKGYAATQGGVGGAGGGVGGGVGGGGTETAFPGPATTPVEERGQLIINIEGDFIGDEEWIDRLVERINEAGDKRDVTIIGDTREYE
jgi:hypothetical protein